MAEEKTEFEVVPPVGNKIYSPREVKTKPDLMEYFANLHEFAEDLYKKHTDAKLKAMLVRLSEAAKDVADRIDDISMESLDAIQNAQGNAVKAYKNYIALVAKGDAVTKKEREDAWRAFVKAEREAGA